MKIGLYIDKSYTYMCGPLKVYRNLKRGLEIIGHEVLTNEKGQLTGCLHDNPLTYTLPRSTIMGPNLFLWPQDKPRYFVDYINFVIPSDWVAPIYTTSPLYVNHKVYSWPVGIDTDLFKVSRNPTVDCVLYFKNREQQELVCVQNLLSSKGQTYVVVEYGKYEESNYLELLKNSRYAVLLTNTESQGIGYMEMLSTNLPCFVLDKTSYHGFAATSVPYFDERCGVVTKFSNSLEAEFEIFLENIVRYCPREYILENHTLEIGARKYLNLLEKCR
jgi:hypothetical protein